MVCGCGVGVAPGSLTHTACLLMLQKALLSDLEATQELCLQLDKSKESLGSQLSTCTIHYDQVRRQGEGGRCDYTCGYAAQD